MSRCYMHTSLCILHHQDNHCNPIRTTLQNFHRHTLHVARRWLWFSMNCSHVLPNDKYHPLPLSIQYHLWKPKVFLHLQNRQTSTKYRTTFHLSDVLPVPRNWSDLQLALSQGVESDRYYSNLNLYPWSIHFPLFQTLPPAPAEWYKK